MAVISSNEIVVGYKVVGQAELQQLAAQFEKITNTQAQSLEEFRKVNNQVKQNTATLNQNTTAAKKAGDETSKAFNDADQSAGKLSGTLRSIGPLIAGAFSVAAIGSFITKVYETTASFQGLRTSIDFASGSMKEGSRNFAFIIDLSQRFGKDLQTLAGAYSSFSASSRLAGITQEKSNYIFESAVKASTALGKSNADTQGILLAFSQIVSKGTVQAEELRGQIGERLPGAFNLAAKAMGVTTKELNKMLEQGQVISAEFLPKFAKELDNAFGEGALAKVNSMTAATGRLGTAWDRFLESLGNASGGFFSGVLSDTSKFLDATRELFTSSEKLREERAQQANQNVVTNLKKELSDRVKLLQETVNKETTIEQVALEKYTQVQEYRSKLIGDIANLRIKSAGSLDKTELQNAQRNLEYADLVLKTLEQTIDGTTILSGEVKKTQAELKKEYEARVKLLEIQKKIADLQIQLKTEAGFERDIQLIRNAEKFGQQRLDIDREFGNKGLEDAKNNAKIQALINRTLSDDAINLIKKEAEAGAKASADLLADIKKQMQANDDFGLKKALAQQKSLQDQRDAAKLSVDIEYKKQQAILDIDKKSKEEKKQLEKDLNELTIQEAQATAQVLSSIGDNLENINNQIVNNRLTRLQRRYDEEIRLADGNAQKITELEEKRRNEEKEIRLKQFRAQQAFAIAQVIFKTTPYIAEYLASGVLAPLAVAALITQGIEIAAIAAQPVPEFYKGVENFEGGFAKVGERGSELIETPKGTFLSPDKPTLTYLPKGTNVITASKTKERMQILNSTYKKGQDQFQTIDTSPIAAELSKMPVAINRFDENGFTQFVRKGNRTTQILNKRKNY
jgi:tape measure domain-containing protein